MNVRTSVYLLQKLNSQISNIDFSDKQQQTMLTVTLIQTLDKYNGTRQKGQSVDYRDAIQALVYKSSSILDQNTVLATFPTDSLQTYYDIINTMNSSRRPQEGNSRLR